MTGQLTRQRKKADAGTITPIARVLLHDEVVARVRDMIVEGRLAGGERISERVLCAAFGISRTPLREALKVLAADGLIELLPNRGAMVRPILPEEARDMLELMGGLEAFAGELACVRGSDSAIAAIRRMHEAMRRHFDRRERRDYFLLNQHIHAAIVAMAENASLSQAHTSLSARMRRIRYIGNDIPMQWEDAMRDHEEILKALLRRDGKRLAIALRRHLASTWQRVAATLGQDATARPTAAPHRSGRRL